MKLLHYHSVAPNARVTMPLMRQCGPVLQPFLRYLAQAIHTAKERQTRYRLPWERVHDQHELSLDPHDTLLRVARPPLAWQIEGWPADRVVDLSVPMMVVNRSLTTRVTRAERIPQGLRVEVDAPLRHDDTVFWCGAPCALRATRPLDTPRALRTVEGSALRVVSPVIEDGESHWQLVVEGRVQAAALRVDDVEVAVEALSPYEGLKRVVDDAGRTFSVSGRTLKVEEPPADGALRGNNGVRFTWRSQRRRRVDGVWVQLLAPSEAIGADEAIDPRAAFCEGDLDVVWTQARFAPSDVIKVRDVDRETYQLLLERLPLPDQLLHLPLDVRSLRLQRRALQQLAHGPLPHHAPLLRLCEDPDKVRWPAVTPSPIGAWYSLVDATRSGTDEQRRFVEKALATPDFAFLQGPPGSGKTTAICELIQQLTARGERVLLCASTHVAIDNVLERLLDPTARGPAIDAVRIGALDRVDEKVQACQIGQRVDALFQTWRAREAFASMGDGDLRAMAERTVVMGANLTCGTTMGILGHPLFAERGDARAPSDGRDGDRPLATAPHWDVLIVDEASKTLTQEFLVPALLARRHVIVGDVRQLPPFTERADLVANLGGLVDAKEREVFPRDHQRAALLLFRLSRKGRGLRWLLVEPPSVLDRIEDEIARSEDLPVSFVRVVARRRPRAGSVAEVTIDEVCSGARESLRLAAADFVLVADTDAVRVARHLPSDLVCARDLSERAVALPESDPWRFRHAHHASTRSALSRPYRDRGREVETITQAEENERQWLAEHTMPDELAWRLTRIHELRWSRSDEERERLQRDVDRLLPLAVDIRAQVEEIQDVGLPSVLEVLQEGIGGKRSQRHGALTEGLRGSQRGAFDARFEGLTFQHRMHPDISAFPRVTFYDGDAALRDANTVAQRDERLGWDFARFAARRAWLDVDGREQGGENDAEVQAARSVVEDFLAWVQRKGAPSGRASGVWEVACLSFYAKQERALSRMLAEVTGQRRSTRFSLEHVEVVCGTVDRFQGREADLVLLSMRNTRRVGFLDSPNRLNVALTRARQQLVVIGHASYFERCGVSELERLASGTRRERAANPRGGRR